MMQYDDSRGDRAHRLRNVLVISEFMRKRGMILTVETQEELLSALADSTPQPNTKDEWEEFGRHWLNGTRYDSDGSEVGGWRDMQWYDTSESAVDDAEWYDFTEEDAFYPYDKNLVIRFKS